MDQYVQLAHKTLEMYLKENKIPEAVNAFADITNKRAGCFVSIHTKNGNLRGCIGTILPTHKNLAGEIISNTIAAAQNDSRFPKVEAKELENLIISVDVLSTPELVESEKDLDAKKYGLIVRTEDSREGLLLPDIKGVDSVLDQIKIAKEKGGIGIDEPISLFRFTTTRHE